MPCRRGSVTSFCECPETKSMDQCCQFDLENNIHSYIHIKATSDKNPCQNTVPKDTVIRVYLDEMSHNLHTTWQHCQESSVRCCVFANTLNWRSAL